MKTLYHISFKDNLSKVMKPRQPHGTGTSEDGKMKEELPPRVSFSPTIQQCFSAIYPNISHVFEDVNDGKGYPYIYMYVYVPVDDKALQIPESVVRKNVWDSHVTGEVCFKTDVNVRLAAKIKIPNPYRKGKVVDINAKPYNKGTEEIFLSPKISFQVMETYGEAISIL